MIKVVITKAELENAPSPWPGATFEHRAVYLMRSKGLSFRYSIDPKLSDLVLPWYAIESFDTGELTIEQG